MEQVKKKLATIKNERDNAIEAREDAERQKKEAEERAEQVSFQNNC